MKLVRIYSNEHRAWWRPDYCGYTNNITKAGVFEYEDAIEHYPRMSYDKDQEDYFVDIDSNELKDSINEIIDTIVKKYIELYSENDKPDLNKFLEFLEKLKEEK